MSTHERVMTVYPLACDGGVDATVSFEVAGRYYPQTQTDPEEFPEFSVSRVTYETDDGETVIAEDDELSPAEWERIRDVLSEPEVYRRRRVAGRWA